MMVYELCPFRLLWLNQFLYCLDFPSSLHSRVLPNDRTKMVMGTPPISESVGQNISPPLLWLFRLHQKRDHRENEKDHDMMRTIYPRQI